MKNLVRNATILAVCLNAGWALAANDAKELDNNKTTADMPEQIQPVRTAEEKPAMKHKKQKKSDHKEMTEKNKMENSKDEDYNSSMNNEPMGTTTDNPNVNERAATNGKKY